MDTLTTILILHGCRKNTWCGAPSGATGAARGACDLAGRARPARAEGGRRDERRGRRGDAADGTGGRKAWREGTGAWDRPWTLFGLDVGYGLAGLGLVKALREATKRRGRTCRFCEGSPGGRRNVVAFTLWGAGDIGNRGRDYNL